MAKETEEKKLTPEEEQEKTAEDKKTSEARITDAQALFSKCSEEMKNVRKGTTVSWDEKEELFFGGYFRTPQENGKKRELYMTSTGEITTQAIDRTCRVMGQMPQGMFENVSGDPGKNLLMNLLFEHYVLENANSGGSMLLKLRMADLYSDLYSIPVFVEWMASKDPTEYTGPDMNLLDPRRFYPQPGKGSIREMDYCFIDTFVSKEWLESRDKNYFKNIDEIVKTASEEGPTSEEVNASDRYDKQSGYRIRHQFTKDGDWLAYNPETQLELLFEPKFYPRIPIVLKHQFKKIGKLWSFTNFDRGFATQKRIDVLSDANEKAVDLMIDPPYIMDPAQVILSSFKKKKGGRWFVKKGAFNNFKPATIDPQALEAFGSSYPFYKSNLMSQSADTDTSIPAKVDPGFGKSPEALKQQGSRKGARDSWDQFMMEEFITEIFTLMADMIAMKGVSKYSFNLMADAIKRLKEEYPNENFEEFLKGSQANIDPKKLAGKYRYKMHPGSTLMEQEDMADALIAMLKLYAENDNIKTDLAAAGQRLDFGAAFKLILREKGSKFADKILVDNKTNPESIAGIGSDGATVPTEPPVEQPPMPPMPPTVPMPVEVPQAQTV